MRRPARRRDRRRELGRAGRRVLQRLRGPGHDARPRRLADEVDVAVPDRADRGDSEHRGANAVRRRSPPRARTAICGRCGSATPTAARRVEEADACFVFIGASPRTDWLEGVVARDERGFILAGPDVRDHGWPLSRDPYVLETSVPGRVRRRGRSHALDQARGERRRRGVDGGLADPRVPRERMSEPERPTLEELRTDRPVRRARRRAARRAGAGRRDSRAARPTRSWPSRGRDRRVHAAAATASSRVWSSRRAGSSRSPARTAPTWMGAITALTETGLRRRDARGDRRQDRRDRPGGLHAAGAHAASGVQPRDARGPSGVDADRRARAEPRAAGVARDDGGRARARAEQPGRPPRGARLPTSPTRSTCSPRRSGCSSSRAIERAQAEELVTMQREAMERAQCARAAVGARCGRRRGRAARGARAPRTCASRGG